MDKEFPCLKEDVFRKFLEKYGGDKFPSWLKEDIFAALTSSRTPRERKLESIFQTVYQVYLQYCNKDAVQRHPNFHNVLVAIEKGILSPEVLGSLVSYDEHDVRSFLSYYTVYFPKLDNMKTLVKKIEKTKFFELLIKEAEKDMKILFSVFGIHTKDLNQLISEVKGETTEFKITQFILDNNILSGFLKRLLYILEKIPSISKKWLNFVKVNLI